jgi:hypothetical protein
MEGALDADAKKDFRAFLTDAVGKQAGIPPQQRAPVFVLIPDVARPPLDAKPVKARHVA